MIIKKYSVLIISFMFFLFVIVASIIYIIWNSGEYRRNWIAPYTVLKANGLTITWEWKSDRINSTHRYILAAEKKLFIRGYLENKWGNKFFVINGEDGALLSANLDLDNTIDFTTDGSLIFASSPGRVACYDSFTGKKIWDQELNEHKKHINSIQLVNSEIQVNAYFKTFFRIDTTNGEIISRNDGSGNVEGNIIRYDLGNHLLFDKDYLKMVDEEGKTIWKRDLPWSASLDDFPLSIGNVIYYRTQESKARIYVIDQLTGAFLWKTKPNIISNVAASPKRVYFLTQDGYLYGVRPSDAKVEVYVQFSGNGFTSGTVNPVAYDPETQNVFVLLQESGQLIAFHEAR